MISSSKWHWIGSKPIEYYKGIRIKADFGLHEQLEEEVLRLAPKDAKILDFGAGEGALSQRLADKGYKLVSVDIDKDSFKAKSPQFIHLNLNDIQAIENFISEY
ncbi:MAG: methyltransferase domain-containing protein, partial [Bdellovibrionales bacterium]|nr:methyltransferase domain-containing protein [Bdellovibrionales bacterium]